MSYRYGEMMADPSGAIPSGSPRRPRVDPEAHQRAWTVCKQWLAGPPGALSDHCKTPPVGMHGYCAEHLPK